MGRRKEEGGRRKEDKIKTPERIAQKVKKKCLFISLYFVFLVRLFLADMESDVCVLSFYGILIWVVGILATTPEGDSIIQSLY